MKWVVSRVIKMMTTFSSLNTVTNVNFLGCLNLAWHIFFVPHSGWARVKWDFCFQLISNSKVYLRPLSSTLSQNPSLVQSSVVQQHKQPTLLPAVRSFQTTPVTRDIDSAAKFIGAGAATVGVAGSGQYRVDCCTFCCCPLAQIREWFANVKCMF